MKCTDRLWMFIQNHDSYILLGWIIFMIFFIVFLTERVSHNDSSFSG